jgi:hypothetical protein
MTMDTSPSRQALSAQNRTLPGKVTGRLKTAITAMVWDGASRKEAAQVAGLSDHGLRQALRRAHVKRFYLAELDVLRTSGRARTLHRLEALRDQDSNKAAAVKACQVLESISDEAVSRPLAAQMQPGLIVVINAPTSSIPKVAPVTIEGEPMPDLDPPDAA